MIRRVHFLLGNHDPLGAIAITDFVTMVRVGLEECGLDTSVSYDQLVCREDTANVMAEHFVGPLAGRLVDAKRKLGDRLRLGLILTEDLSDRHVFPEEGGAEGSRLDGLLKILPVIDFAWSMLPDWSSYEPYCDTTSFRYFAHGISPRLRSTAPRLESELDIDVLFVGNVSWQGRIAFQFTLSNHSDDFFPDSSTAQYPYRIRTLKRLQERGLRVGITGGFLPNYARNNLLSRTKIGIDIRRSENVLFISPGRMHFCINNALATVTEEVDRSALSQWYDFSVATDPGRLVEACIDLVNNDPIARGEEFYERALRDCPLSDCARAALDIPIFRG